VWQPALHAADPAAVRCNDDKVHADAAAAGGCADGAAGRPSCSSNARVRLRSSMERPRRPISDSRSRCSTGRGRRQSRRSTRCRTTLNTHAYSDISRAVS